MDDVEIWAGHECSIARIGDAFRSEGAETGHDWRDDDIARIAQLGVRTIRYPALWESVAPRHPDDQSWETLDRRLNELRRRTIDPILGLLHHGSGPRYTSLLDPRFPELLAAYAGRVAARYPWVTRFTPVNEPLTTARFSGLYGHWFPHEKNDRAFLRALVQQCRGIVLSMQAIREVTPEATLVQTEDLGRIFSTPKLGYQAAFENERRWLSFDLLCGRVDRRHPLWAYCIGNQMLENELEFFLANPCLPAIIGIDHYLTSDRYLDADIGRYPQCFHGGNGAERYADIDAVRAPLAEELLGPKPRLFEAWERYRLPIAVTEAHHGCSRDEQLRWFIDVWRASCALRREGVDIRAVTSWALFGCMDWNSLLVRKQGHYEPGAFDARCDPPRRTIVGTAVAALARGEDFDHPVLDSPGWWRRAGRGFAPTAERPRPRRQAQTRRVLIAGANGMLGRAFSRICEIRGLEYVPVNREVMDIADPSSIAATLDEIRPWAVLNAAGYVRLIDADQDRCMRENAVGPALLAQACEARGVRFVTFSSDLVFDGRLGRAYVENDRPAPLCPYGLSKAAAERGVLSASPQALVVRTSAFFCPWDKTNFAYRTLARLAEGQGVEASASERVAPTYVPDLVHVSLDLLIDGESGVWHLANAGEVSWHAFALRLAESARLRRPLVRPLFRRQRNTTLVSARGRVMPTLDNAIERFFRDSARRWANGG
jgi:dTDP-4-dehydrorhamnose reductase